MTRPNSIKSTSRLSMRATAFTNPRDSSTTTRGGGSIWLGSSFSTSRAESLSNMGWHQAAIEICGSQRARVSDPFCRARGDSHCEYVCEWD